MELKERVKEGMRGGEEGQAPEGMNALLSGSVPGVKSPRRGDVVEGVVVSVGPEGIMVDIGTKSEGFIPTSEVQSLGPESLHLLKVGQAVLVYVLQTENEEGQVVLSLDRARAESGWRALQSYFETGEVFEAEVVDYNKGGLIVNVEGVRAFVPTSQVRWLRANEDESGRGESPLAQKVGQRLRLKVIEINRRRNRVILSERQALQEWRNQQRERLLGELHPGEIRHGVVSSICAFGAFVDLGGADGLAHLSELSWDRVEDPHQVLKVGDEVDVYVMIVDQESKRISLSLRRAQPEKWAEIAAKYHVGQLVTGTITKLAAFGAFARIEGPLEGLIHLSELSDKRLQHPKEVVKEGDVLTLKILGIEPERHRLALSLKQAQNGSG